MNNRPATQSFGWNLGIVSGVFAALQVLVSASSARANIYSIESMRWALSRLQTGGGNPLPLIGSLMPVMLMAYASIIVTGAISLGLSWYAGRLTAYVRGRRSGGAGAGFRVALLSGLIWIGFSVIVSLLMHGDGTITGVLASTHDGSSLGPQLIGLLFQEILFAAIGLGLGAWAGYIGASGAPLPKDLPTDTRAGVPYAVYGMYPAYPPVVGYPGYPVALPQQYPPRYPQQYPYGYPAPYFPPQPTNAAPPMYPPPPDYYRAAKQQEPQPSAPAESATPPTQSTPPPAQ